MSSDINQTGDPTFRQRLPLYPTQLIGAILMASFGPLLDPMMKDLGIPLSRAGLISAGFFLGGVVGIVLCNTTLARVPAKWALIIGNGLGGLVLMVVGLASWSLWSVCVGYFVVGGAGALANTMCWAWLAAHVKKNMAAAALQMIVVFGMGMIVIPLILGLALDGGASWRWVLVVEGGLGLVLGLVFVLSPFPDVPERRNIRPSDLKQVIKHNRGLLLGMAAACFTYAGAETTLNVWLPKYQIEVFGAGDTWASLSVTLFWVGLVLGRLVVIRMTARYSPSRLLLACACVLAVFCVILALAPSQVAALLLSVGAGLGASASYGLIGSYSGRFPGWQSGVASSLFILGGSLGCAVFPYLMGPIASGAGFRVGMAVIAVPALAYGLLSLLLHARSGEGHP